MGYFYNIVLLYMNKKTKKESEKIKKPTVIVKLKCRECGCKSKLAYTEEEKFENLSLKAARCAQCQKFGRQVATTKIEGKTIRKAVLTYYFYGKRNKKVEITKETNNNYKEKKKIYPKEYSREEINKSKPFHGINHPSNHGINGDCLVDEACHLI